MTTLYGIKNCDSVKKAKKWLEQNDLDYQFHDFRAQGITIEKINAWLTQVQWDVLLNKRGTSYRQLDAEVKENLNADNVAELLLNNPTLIKRPVLEYADKVSVGFKADEYQVKFNK
ncbi:ArsC family reductase [Catenovulum sp. SM1970]|uniref:ArsC family reductase n=1 Tax=Marinifaba aquimaris TaxID=2741323 RepID=UPI00157494A7|nr:ArsC family reductase [Marinifaba aquimaris]NTS76034.1 ArsC family reductase [Marinifaba aquimaris]